MAPKKLEPKYFNVGDFVFAKMYKFRPWPARILKIEKNNSYLVFFYGSCDTTHLKGSKLFNYEEYKERFAGARQMKNARFRHAMQHLEKVLADPGQDVFYYKVKSDTTKNKTESSTEEESAEHFRTSPLHITGDAEMELEVPEYIMESCISQVHDYTYTSTP